MGLDLPDLDDREYEDTLAEAKKLIPAYADDWTDFNPHDPGITILEVLSWLTETHTYQIDKITDDYRRKYLGLMGERPRPPTPATVPLSLSAPEEVAGRVPEGTRLAVADGTGGTVHFETSHDVVLTPASIAAVHSAGGAGETEYTHENDTEGMYYRPFGDSVSPGDALYLGFDRDPFGEAGALSLTVEYYESNLPDPNPDDGAAAFEPSVDLAWEYYRQRDDAWVEAGVRADGTDALYHGGHVELAAPAPSEQFTTHGLTLDGVSTEYYWLRCRVRESGYEIPPQIRHVGTNAVAARHRVSKTGEQLRQVDRDGATALDGQTYAFEHAPVLSATVRVDGDRWQAVPDFDAAGPDDRRYVLDHDEGTVTFGDGLSGATPPADATVVADYEYGGGTAGNVAGTAAWHFEDDASDLALSAVDVTARSPATGGRDSESIEAALRRVRRDLRTPHRAVTVEDFEAIAARTPGLRIARTNVLADGDGVDIVVVPFVPADVARPSASEGFLSAVRNYVGERKLLTDSVTVRSPRYVGLDVTVTGRARPGYADRGNEAAVRAAIEEYVHPLTGFEGEGWPFGRPLTDAELRERITALDAIDQVSDLTVTAHGGAAADDGVIRIDEASLFYVESVQTNLATVAAETGGV